MVYYVLCLGKTSVNKCLKLLKNERFQLSFYFWITKFDYIIAESLNSLKAVFLNSKYICLFVRIIITFISFYFDIKSTLYVLWILKQTKKPVSAWNAVVLFIFHKELDTAMIP